MSASSGWRLLLDPLAARGSPRPLRALHDAEQADADHANEEDTAEESSTDQEGHGWEAASQEADFCEVDAQPFMDELIA